MTRFANLGDALARDVDPNAVAVIDLGGEIFPRLVTCSDLDRQSAAVARGLLKRGLRRGDTVAIVAANRIEFLLVFFGAMRAGLVAVPVNFKLPPATIKFIMEDCAAKFIFADRARLAMCPGEIPAVVFGEDFPAFLDHGDFESVVPEPAEPAMFLYTSGSTGRPKGVVLSHQSHLWVIDIRLRPPLKRGQRLLVAAPLYHMNGLAMSQAALGGGNAVVLLPQFTAVSYIAAAAQYRVNGLTAVPTMIAMMLRETALLAGSDLLSVRSVRMGSAPVPQSLIDQIRTVFPNAELSNGYGTTEAGPVVFGPHPDGLAPPDLSVGCAHPDVQIRLMRDGSEVFDEGVMEMRCPAMMNGYHNLPDTTRKVMTADGFYNTSDVFRRDENGFFFFVGRSDDMFVCGGENIYPGEVEKMLERHPDVQQVCVLPVADELKGFKPVAFVVTRPGSDVDEDDIRRFALEHAPAYQHPRKIFFLAEFPLAGTNKVDRKALASLL